MERKLPIGIQSFEKIRRDGFVYVDKTSYIHRLVRDGKPYILSRPRRFGKSLLVSTMRAYFEGRSELFEGLEIERLEEEDARKGGREPWVIRPVFHFDFTGQDYRMVTLEKALGEQLLPWEAMFGPQNEDRTLGFRFQMLLEQAHAQSGHRCVVLVDEYDKPLLDVMEDDALLDRNRGILKGFFSVLKKADDHLRFVFLTGVTKSSKVSIFSDLNQLSDISLERDYAGICGVTETELGKSFAPELSMLGVQLGLDAKGCLQALRAQYDGYCFHPDGPAAMDAKRTEPDRMVYNPFSLINALQKRRLGSWWFESGTPTFLVRRMREASLDPNVLRTALSTPPKRVSRITVPMIQTLFRYSFRQGTSPYARQTSWLANTRWLSPTTRYATVSSKASCLPGRPATARRGAPMCSRFAAWWKRATSKVCATSSWRYLPRYLIRVMMTPSRITFKRCCGLCLRCLGDMFAVKRARREAEWTL